MPIYVYRRTSPQGYLHVSAGSYKPTDYQSPEGVVTFEILKEFAKWSPDAQTFIDATNKADKAKAQASK